MTAISIRTGTNNSTSFGSGPGAFDPKYYLARNPDVARQLAALEGTDKSVAALRHFIDYGAKEFRNPSAQFDVKAYLNAYPDVARSGVNPLLHFRQHGAAEGRQAFAVAERPLGSAVPAVPVAGKDPGVFDLLGHGLGLGGPILAFQTGGAAAVLGSPAAQAMQVPGAEVWAHGAALLQPVVAQGAGGIAFLPGQPVPAAFAASLHGPGAETILPGVGGAQEVRLMANS